MSAPDASKRFYLPVPAGTPYSLIAEAVNKFNLELVEKDIVLPGSAKDEYVPKGWFLEGEKENLVKAKEYIYQGLKERIKKFE
ncbi:MAG: hypothetical protein FJZ49_07465 [Candidatus Verstraetearchaeota archaeon]|nr:hypothetical protein [Candidatus Verstraetearchaeota archaeon]